MRILIISDGHGAKDLLDRLGPVMKDADAVLFGGDFAQVGKPETGKPFLERLAHAHDRIFAVTGNCDAPSFKDSLDEYDISIEGSLSYYCGLVLSGSGGGSKFDGTTPNERTDEELVSDLHLVAECAGDENPDEENPVEKNPCEKSPSSSALWNNLILVIHNPPKDTKLDVITNGAHVGSPLIRAFIEKYRPLLVVSGHIHESAAIDKIGGTTLINPGALLQGKYAIAEISGGGKKPFVIDSITLESL